MTVRTTVGGCGPAPADRPSARYPYLVSVRGTSPAVPARKEDGYFWLRHEMYLGIVWPPKNITVLEVYEPAETPAV